MFEMESGSIGAVVHPANVYSEEQDHAWGRKTPDMQSVSVNDMVSQDPEPGSK